MWVLLSDFGLLAILTTIAVVGIGILGRHLASYRTRWRYLDKTYTQEGAPISDQRSAADIYRDKWGERALGYQSGHVARREADIAILGVSHQEYALNRALLMIASLLLMAGLVGVTIAILGSAPPPIWLLVVAGPVVAGWVMAPMSIKKRAAQQRSAVSAHFFMYLRIAALYIANGRPGPAAVKLAALIAKDATFRAVNVFLERGAALNEQPSEVFRHLGEAWHHDDIILTSLTLRTAESGGTMRQAILSQAKSLSEKHRFRMREQANLATQRAQFPQAVIAILVMLYLLYPAMSQL